jgi:ribosomal-protein-alanine N-acetyltransferase
MPGKTASVHKNGYFRQGMTQEAKSTSEEYQVPALSSEHLILRNLRQADIASVQRNFEDYEIVRFLNAPVPWPYPADGAATWHREVHMPGHGTKHWSWAICSKEAPDELIGVIELFAHGHSHISNRGFWLGRRFWNRGHMTEDCTIIDDYAFDGKQSISRCNGSITATW